jgi:hypothetical protein
MKRAFATALLFSAPILGIGAELPVAARSEVEHLLTVLGASSCEFYRNGSWHAPSEAQVHLRTKYEYLLKKGLIGSTEEFIAKGATQSSMSGEPYQVRCPNEATQPSSVWLSNKLRALRDDTPRQ